MAVWVVCGICGSRDVTRDGLARWDEINQKWELSSELDNTDCEACGDEAALEEEEILSNAECLAALRKDGLVLADNPKGANNVYALMHGDKVLMECDEVADAYLWALYHDSLPPPAARTFAVAVREIVEYTAEYTARVEATSDSLPPPAARTFAVAVREIVEYTVRVEAMSESEAEELAPAIWAASGDPTHDHHGIGQGVSVQSVVEVK